ncbi:ACP S-malonyltransferase [Alphaproteobacteria bacterium]|nr:ACP S-malonyltransferase [Alphaproteobacteria bacterium]
MNILAFPGQGSQKIGMGKLFYNNFLTAKMVFEEVDETLKFKLSKLIFDGDIKELSLTKHTQPALMAVSIAILRVFLEENNININQKFKFVCGHSLGEFTALCAANVLTLKDTANLLKIRGQSMQEAVPQAEGSMAALISSDFSKLDDLLNIVKKYGVCEIANDNSFEQIVVSGHTKAVQELVNNSSKFSIKRALLLNVSAPFHCSLMMPAQKRLQNELKNIPFKEPDLPIICNYTAVSESNPLKLKDNIINQVTNKVRWKETMQYALDQKIDKVLECGSGKVLCGLFKRFSQDFNVYNIETIEDLKDLEI